MPNANTSVSDYARELIEQEQKRADQLKLEAMLLEGLESGDPIELTNESWKAIRQQAIERIEKRKSKSAR